MPPPEGVAIKLAIPPGHIVAVGPGHILTEGLMLAETVMVIGFDVTGEFLAQVAFDVIITVTTSPVFKIIVNVGELVPTLTPFTCH